MRPRAATAFAPATITNFFDVVYDGGGRPAGATGGGYVLSLGVTTKVNQIRGVGVHIRVNGDSRYAARTTRRALALFASAFPEVKGGIDVEQRVDVPIGGGFGSSAASALSAVYACAAAARIRRPKRELARFAYRAEKEEQTGLGTVSVVYGHVGAGAIVSPGRPGEARYVTARVPKGTRIVTAFVGPFDKRDAFASPSVRRRVSSLGRRALQGFLSDPTLPCLASQGEMFSAGLGLESPVVKKLEATAKSAGALFASQNMIGYSVHCITDESSTVKVLRALRGRGARVDSFEVGKKAARVLRPTRRSRAPS